MKEIIFKTDARTQLGNGINALAEAVKVTLGPRDRKSTRLNSSHT